MDTTPEKRLAAYLLDSLRLATGATLVKFAIDGDVDWASDTQSPTSKAIKSQIGEVGESFVPRSLVNGSFVETFNALVISDGVTVSLTLEQAGGSGGDLTMQFSDGLTILDTTPALVITLTPGTFEIPQVNYVYILQSAKVLVVSTTGWPSDVEHIKVGYFYVQDAVSVQDHGALINQNWNDHLSGTDNQGHLLHMAGRSRLLGAIYYSGIDPAGVTNYLTSTPGSVTLQVSGGVILQLHKHTYLAQDTSLTDHLHVINDFTQGYFETQNLYDVTTDALGGTLSNKYFTFILWSVANKGGEYDPLMVNMPTGTYNQLSAAQSDLERYTVLDIPRSYVIESSTGFLIAAITVHETGGTWEFESWVDLRHERPSTVVGGAGSGIPVTLTEFPDDLFKIYDNLDTTKQLVFTLDGLSTGVIREYKTPNVSGELALLTDITDGQTLVTNNGVTGAISILDTGYVGIGTAAPAYKLDVRGDAFILTRAYIGTPSIYEDVTVGGLIVSGGVGTDGTYDFIRVATTSNNVDTKSRIAWKHRYNAGSYVGVGQLASYISSERDGSNGIYALTFGTAIDSSLDAVEYMRIHYTGNVGIRTTAPTVEFEVVGEGKFSSYVSGIPAVNSEHFVTLEQLDDTVGDNTYWSRNAGNGYIYPKTLADKVGIGTNTPTSPLSIQIAGLSGYAQNMSVSTGNLGIRFYLDGATGINDKGALIILGDPSSATWTTKIAIDSRDGMASYFNGTGNLGIGTVSPNFKLDVAGTGYFQDDVLIGSRIGIGTTTTGHKVSIVNDESIQGFNLAQNNNVHAAMVVTTDRYGILLTSLEVSNAYYLLKLRGNNGSTEAFYVGASGNVGIGTISPAETVDIYGNILLGDNWSSAGNRTDGTLKTGEILIPHATNAEETLLAFRGVAATDGTSYVTYGGGSANWNAFNSLRFLTAENDTTTSGTERMRIIGTGEVGIGTITPSYTLDIVGDLRVSIIDPGTTDYDKFLVSDAGVVKYRTGLEVAGDIGLTGKYLATDAAIGTLPSEYNADLDDLLVSAQVWAKSTSLNIPNINGGSVWSSAWYSSSDHAHQMYLEYSTGNFYWRHRTSNVWYGWEQVASQAWVTGEIDAQDLQSVTDVGADTTNEITVPSILIDTAKIDYAENLDVDSAATEVIATVLHASYDAVFFDYSVKNGTNLRAGTVTTTHDGVSTVYTDTSTTDLGSTSGVVFSTDISGTDLRLLATVTTDNWVIKTMIRAI